MAGRAETLEIGGSGCCVARQCSGHERLALDFSLIHEPPLGDRAEAVAALRTAATALLPA
jgi:hypothetical protein